ncbi:sugar ABC transporter substrate-binding protein [Nocardioides sp. Bht2]|uniref:sugar ABC transporter substrate-binding protein n=1 Tax=Nocardioides sp. Bht2 TaxID=3392297 RepID=UPI0039B62DF1
MSRFNNASKVILASASVLALSATLAACGSDSKSSSDGGAVRMAFVNGFSGGGPVDDFIAGLTCYADQNDLDKPVITVADGDVNKQLNDIDSLIARSGQIDGLFVMPVDPAALKPAYERARKADLAVIDPVSPDAEGKFATDASSHVAPDDAGVPALLVKYLTDEHADVKRVALLSPPPGQPMSDQRASLFKKEAAAAGIEVARELNMDKITTEEAQKKVEDLLTSDKSVDAIFAQNGAMARGAALAAKSQGVDLVIISIDSDGETLAAVKSGDIDATFGADLFNLAYQSSVQAEKIKAGEKVDFLSLPYQAYTSANAEVPSAAERCAAVK